MIYERTNVSAWCHRSPLWVTSYQVKKEEKDGFHLFFVTANTEVYFLPRFMLFAQSAQLTRFLCDFVALIATVPLNQFKSTDIDD